MPAFRTAVCWSCQRIRLGMAVTITGVTAAGAVWESEVWGRNKMAIAVM